MLLLKFSASSDIPIQKYKGSRAIPESQQLKSIDRCFKSFSYREALNVALKNPSVSLFVSCVQELSRRDALQVAFSGRTEIELIPVLKIISRHFYSPRYASTLFQLLEFVIRNFGHQVSNSQHLENLLRSLLGRMKIENLAQENLHKIKSGLFLIDSCAI